MRKNWAKANIWLTGSVAFIAISEDFYFLLMTYWAVYTSVLCTILQQNQARQKDSFIPRRSIVQSTNP